MQVVVTGEEKKVPYFVSKDGKTGYILENLWNFSYNEAGDGVSSYALFNVAGRQTVAPEDQPAVKDAIEKYLGIK